MVDYEDFLYCDFPHPETHPDRLACLGTLLGLSPTSPDQCRVLELGCGLGGNLIGLAVALPGSSFVGIDRSAKQIAAGQEVISTLGLSNIALHAQDILEFAQSESLGTFDYILCHGIYSWVPPPVRAAILQIIGRCLSPQGIAYVSYNTLPGWHMRGMVRELLRRHAGDGTHTERLARARAFLTMLESVPSDRSPAHAYLSSEVRLLGQLGDEYLFYEHLVDENQPLYFRDFAEAAARVGLQYLGDAHQQSTLQTRLGQDALEAIATADVVEQEQHLDYLELRFFRRTLLCRSELQVVRKPGVEQLRKLRVLSLLQPESELVDPHAEAPHLFRGAGERGVSVHEPLLKVALELLSERAPATAPFVELCEASWAWLTGVPDASAPPEAFEQLAGSIVRLLGRGFVQLRLGGARAVPVPGLYPLTTSLVRLQAARGNSCTNLRHESVQINDLDRALLRRLDGTRMLETLWREVLTDLADGEYGLQRGEQSLPVTDPTEVYEIVEQQLQRLARAGFLLA